MQKTSKTTGISSGTVLVGKICGRIVICQRLFKEYDSWDDETKSKFFFTDVKEKFGGMRIYTTFSSNKHLEMIAE